MLIGFDLCRAAMAVEAITAPEQGVLLVLAVMANDDAQCWPSIAGLVAKTKLSERTVQRAVQSLKDVGHINWVDRPGRGRVYIVHPRQTDTAYEATPATVTPVSLTPRHSDTPVTETPTPVTVAPKLPRTTIPQKASPSSVAHASKALGFHRMPDGWIPTKPFSAALQAKLDDWPPGKLDDELDALRAWAANAKNEQGKGRKLDWDQAAHNWLKKADDDWRSRNGPRNGIVALAGNRSRPESGYGITSDAGFAFISDGGPH